MTNLIEAAIELMSRMMASPPLLLAWLGLLVVANLGSLAFLFDKQGEARRLRPEALAIFLAFNAAFFVMVGVYNSVGYVRLLGLGHLLCWTPVYLWIFGRRRELLSQGAFGRYVLLYLLVSGISLVIDAVDVLRYFAGDGAL